MNIYIPSFKFSDIFEIGILIFLIYKIIQSLRNTRAMVVLKGVFLLFIFYNIAYILQFQAIVVIFQSVIAILIVALIVVFQPEMRRILEQIGTQNISSKFDLKSLFSKEKKVAKYYSDKSVHELTKACFSMGAVKTGALIVIERNIPLVEYINTGIALNADLTSQLLINIFEKNTPLHDGAVVQIEDKLISATCYLPLSNNMSINKNLGTRHRAAIGATESTDCIVLVVSEETGHVSLVVDGQIHTNLTKEQFRDLLFKYQVKDEKKEQIRPEEVITNTVFQKNFATLVLSVLVGVIGWVLLMNVANPITTKTFENIPIEFVNTSIIENTGNTFEVLSDTYVTVKVTDARSIIDSLTREDITVIADFSKLSYVNAISLEGYINRFPTTTIEFVDTNTISVELDSIISKEVEIQFDKIMSSNSSTYVPVLNSDTMSLIITGGKARVDTIDKVVCTYDISNAEDLYEGTAIPVIYDRNGDILDNSLFTLNTQEVIATGMAYPIKSVPVEVTLGHDVISGYKVSNIEYSPQSINVVGENQYLKLFNKLSIELEINVDSNKQFVRTINIVDYLPEGIYLADENKEITVTIDFEALNSKSIFFSREDISIVGDIEGYKVSLLEKNFSIVISGEDEILKTITKETIKPYIDLTNLSVGTYNLIVQFEGLDNVYLASNISVRIDVTER